jgi:hypothetical protein
MAFSYKALHIHSSLTNFRKFPEPEILTVIRKKKGRLKGHFRAKVPVRKGKTAILTSCQQPTGLHRSFRAVGPYGCRQSTSCHKPLGSKIGGFVRQQVGIFLLTKDETTYCSFSKVEHYLLLCIVL